MQQIKFHVRPEEIERFRRDGFFVTASPIPEGRLEFLRLRHAEIALAWAATEWPEGVHKLASQFCMMGEPAFALAEEDAFLSAAREILGTDELFVGACAAGDTVTAESIDGRPVTSLQWHSAPGRGSATGPRWDQVAFRFPLDVHDRRNGGLHLVPGTQNLPKQQAEELLRGEVAGSPDYLEWEGLFFGHHPDQVELYPTPGEMIVWTPDVWHCTGANAEHRPRRSITWTYFPAGGRFRDHQTIAAVLGENGTAGWSVQRRRLWGLS